MTFFILCSFFFLESAFSRQTWNRNFVKVLYDPINDSVDINFELFDYHFGPANENGYLEYCDFAFAFNNNEDYYYLMRAEINDQAYYNWTWVNMKNKLINSDLYFYGSYEPLSGTEWDDNILTQKVKVYNKGSKAFLTIKWFLPNCAKIGSIRVSGKWHVNGVYSSDYFCESYNVDYLNYCRNCSSKSLLNDLHFINNEQNKHILDTNQLKVFKEADDLVIKDAEQGEEIKVYTVSGSQINSIIANQDEIKIKLPVNQIYTVKVGHSRFKVAM